MMSSTENDNLDETHCPSNKEDYHLPLDENHYIRDSTNPCNTQVDLARHHISQIEIQLEIDHAHQDG